MQALLVGVRVVGDPSRGVVRQTGQGVHAAGLTGREAPGQAGGLVPRVRLQAVGHVALVHRGRQPGRVELRAPVGLLGGGQARVGQHDHDHVERLGDAPGGDDRVEAVLDRARRDDHLRGVAVAAEDRGEQIALLDLGRLAGARPAALHVDHDQRDLGHHRQADGLLLERVAGARGDRHGALAGVGRADREGRRGDLVLGLVHHAADLGEDLAEVVRGGGGRRDGVHRADLHAGRHHAQREGHVAVHDHLAMVGRRRRHVEGQVQVGQRPLVPRGEQGDVGVDELAGLLAEGQCDLVAGQVEVELVDRAQHAERVHVLAAPRVGDQLAALPLHRDLDDPVAGGDQQVVRLGVGRGDPGVAVVTPHVLEQDRAARLELPGVHPAEQHLLVERDDEVGLVAAVGDRPRAQPDPVAAGAGDAARRRLDLGGDDLDRPHPVAGAGRDRAERLPAALGALARVADDLHDVLGERDDLPLAGVGAVVGLDRLHRAHRAVTAVLCVGEALPWSAARSRT